MSRTLKLWITTALALIVYCLLVAVLVFLLARRFTLSGDAQDTLKHWLWGLGVAAAAAVLWFRRPAPTPKRPPDDVDTLLASADRTLAQSTLGVERGRRASLATLPTVVVLGPEASVKTTVVTRSGLEPELLAGAAEHDGVVAPTTAVNVWYARGTLFVEAGAPVLVAPDRWARLVRRLQPDRRAAVLGWGAVAGRVALVCFSCEEFLRGGAGDAAEAAARTLRTRLAELSQQLGVPLPVYVMFTKLDRVSFFAEFMQHFSREESVDVLGTTLPLPERGDVGLYEQREARRLERAFARLYGALADRRTMVLRREHAEERRWDAYEFPREFRKLAAPATRFLLELCRPSQLGVSPFLRGFYFSGVQAVMVHDVAPAAARGVAAERRAAAGAAGAATGADATGAFRAVGSVAAADAPARSSTLTPPRKVPRWMFLGRFFDDVLLADGAAAAMTGGGTRVELARRALATGAVAAAVLAGVAITASYVRNDGLLQEAAAAVRGVAALPPTPAGVPSLDVLRALDTLRQQVDRVERHAGEPPLMSWGLYRGDRVRDGLWRTYFDALDQQGLGRTRRAIATSLGTLSDSAGGDRYTPTYELLKAHLMTTSEPRRADSAFLAPVLARAWAGTAEEARRALLERQVAFYAGAVRAGRNPYPTAADSIAVGRARAFLNGFVASDRIYAFVLAQAAATLPAVSLRQRFPRAAAVVQDDHVVPGAFTAAGWPAVQTALTHLDRYLSGDEWVLGPSTAPRPDVAALRDTLRARYRRAYIDHWTTFVRQARVVDAAQHLPDLGGNGSPIFQLLSLAAHNTAVPDSLVKQTFAPVHAVSPPTDSGGLATKAADPYLQAMQQLATATDKWHQAPPGQKAAASGDVERAAADAKAAANALANAAPADPDGRVQAAVRDLLVAPAAWANGVTRGAAATDLAAAGKSVCDAFKPLEGKYPLDPAASKDAAPSDVAALLRPEDGKLWVYAGQMSSYVTHQGNTWAVVPGAPVSPAFTEFLTRAARLADALFPGGAKQPQVSLAFDRTAGTLPPHAERVHIVINGALHRIDEKSADTKKFDSVAMSSATDLARIAVQYGQRDTLVIASQQGPWAVLRLIQRAEHWGNATGGRHEARWSARDKTGAPVKVTMLVTAGEAAAAVRPEQSGGQALRCRPP